MNNKLALVVVLWELDDGISFHTVLADRNVLHCMVLLGNVLEDS